MSGQADPRLQPKPVSGGDDPAARLRAATDPRTPADMLDYLSRDSDARVRRSVAANPAAPESANFRLAGDEVPRVRGAVGCKIAVVGLGNNPSSPKWRTGFSILESLAADLDVSVRRTLAQALVGGREAPDAIVNGMLRDPDPEIARILLHDPNFMPESRLARLMERDLPEHAQQAIASRPALSEQLAAVVVRMGAPGAIRALIENASAGISDESMSEILDRAPLIPEWHDPLVRRSGLADRFIVRIARFAPPSLVTTLKGRAGLRPEIKAAIDRVTLARFELSKQRATRDAAYGIGPCAAATISDGKWESPEDRARKLFEQDRLDAAAIQVAIEADDTDFVVQALALRSGAPLAMATRIMNAGGAKAVAALCWRAELPLKLAMEIQQRIARIPPKNLVRGEGPYYPMLESEMYKLLFYFKD